LQGGWPPFDPMPMFKILVIQANNLSDERTEFLINDRLSFMQFLGLHLSDRLATRARSGLFVTIRRGRRGWRSRLMSPLLARCRFPADLDQLDEALDAEVGEGHDALFVEPLDPNHAVLRLHFDGDVEQEVDVLAEFPWRRG
jgi:hypothetical protein